MPNRGNNFPGDIPAELYFMLIHVKNSDYLNKANSQLQIESAQHGHEASLERLLSTLELGTFKLVLYT